MFAGWCISYIKKIPVRILAPAYFPVRFSVRASYGARTIFALEIARLSPMTSSFGASLVGSLILISTIIVVLRRSLHLYVINKMAWRGTEAYVVNRQLTLVCCFPHDLLMAINTYGGAVLILLDLSAAFDTINHTILLQRQHELGIRDAALDWFKSYLSQRRQSVVINGTRSSHRNMSFRVPQGSVHGPILFTLYTTPLGAIARKYPLNFHLYADDTQLYMSFKPNNAESLPLVISNIKNCVIDIKSWMTANMLQLNIDRC